MYSSLFILLRAKVKISPFIKLSILLLLLAIIPSLVILILILTFFLYLKLLLALVPLLLVQAQKPLLALVAFYLWLFPQLHRQIDLVRVLLKSQALRSQALKS